MKLATKEINGETIHIHLDLEAAYWGGHKYNAILDSYDPTPIDYDTPAENTVGYGNTEQEALDDLLYQLEENEK